MSRVHSVSQRPNLRHLGVPLGGAKSLLAAMSFMKATKGMGRLRGRVANARWERVPHSRGCNTETTGGKKANVVRTRVTDSRLVFAERKNVYGTGDVVVSGVARVWR